MRQIFEDDETEGCLLIDAGNAFNALAREATLWNCRIMWPSGSRFLFNTYRGYARIFINGTDEMCMMWPQGSRSFFFNSYIESVLQISCLIADIVNCDTSFVAQ